MILNSLFSFVTCIFTAALASSNRESNDISRENQSSSINNSFSTEIFTSMTLASKSTIPKIINISKFDTNVTIQAGSSAYLPCNVQRLQSNPVSWVRILDGHILTVDETTFISDERFQAVYSSKQDRWSLQIKYVKPEDLGLYECQVSTEPKISTRVFLRVIAPITELIGEKNRFVKVGSKVTIHCIVRGSLEPPTFIVWFHDGKQINQDNLKGWYMEIDHEIFGSNNESHDTIGSLIIPFVKKSDSGNYTCRPSNSFPVTLDLHVLSGEYSASAIMSSGVQLNLNQFYTIVLYNIIFFIL